MKTEDTMHSLTVVVALALAAPVAAQGVGQGPVGPGPFGLGPSGLGSLRSEMRLLESEMRHLFEQDREPRSAIRTGIAKPNAATARQTRRPRSASASETCTPRPTTR